MISPSFRKKITEQTALARRSVFLKNFSYVFTGNGLAMGIGLLFTPVFSRIYSPEAYGLFALYMSLTAILTQVISLQYPRAFVIPKENDKFYKLVALSLLLITVISLIVLGVIVVNKQAVLETFNATALGNWIYLIPLTLFFSGINDVWRSWNIRIKEFKKGALALISSTLVTRLFTLTYGLLTQGGAAGLLAGDFLGKPSDTLMLQGRKIRLALPAILKNINLKTAWNTAVEFKQYPLFVLPGAWVFTLVLQLPIIFLSIYFSNDQLGYYSITNSLFVLPMSLLTAALAPVFLQKIAETYHSRPKDIAPMVKKLFWALHIAGLIPFSILIVFGDILLPFFLGDQWVGAGFYASVLGFYFIFYINSYVLNSLYRVYKKESTFLMVNVLMLLMCWGGLWIGTKYYGDVKAAIIGFCIANAVGQVIHIAFNLRMAGVPVLKNLLSSTAVALFAVGILYGIRMLIE